MATNITVGPEVTTRTAMTEALVNEPIPSNASPRFRKLVTGLQNVLRLILEHPAMAPNVSQNWNVPAASKNEVYFMWDFTGRTLGMLFRLDPTLPASGKEDWDEAYGRAVFGNMLINDESGMLKTMTEQGYKAEYGSAQAESMLDLGKDFGVEIKEASNRAVEDA